MKKLLSLMAILLFPCMAFAGYESLTVSSVAVGLASAPTGYGGNQASCVLTLETAPIRFRMDGTAPTALIGHIMAPGATLKLQGEQIAKFKAIQLNTVDATIRATCNDTGSAMLDNTDLSYSRTPVSFYAVAHAAGATTVYQPITLIKAAGLASVTTGTSFTVTAGKKLRITGLSVGTRGHNTATAQSTVFSVITNSAGLVTAGSTTVIQLRSATPAVANDWDRVMYTMPDGYEIQGDGTLQFGVGAISTFTTNAPTLDVQIMGFEY
jgi:hypothetical protein